MTNETPSHVASSATQPDLLTLDTLTVIGVISGQAPPAALVRSSRGDIARVSPGETAFGVVIAAIDGNQVVLTDRVGTQHVLSVPGS
ncbi:hypothetical protein [Yoonia maritima]|uniref:hypothetical protein n=1 Tax=Yoonia maritima TaxID=1435347 RepID=UPI000D10C384|nr:hypothetical protein [Yoonia maritima]